MFENDLEFTSTEDLVKELHKRYDVFFLAGMLAEPGPEDDALHYWTSTPMPAAASLVQYALSHFQIQAVRDHIIEREQK